MKTITFKLEPDEYTNLTDIFDEHDVVVICGARGAGKSYPVAKHISKMLHNDLESKFIYMRTRDKELSTFFGWCKDMDLKSLAGMASVVNLKRGKPSRGDILLEGFDDDGMPICNRIIGMCMSLESSHDYKSGNYEEFKSIVYEEYAHLNMNPQTEKSSVFNFLENVESIFRRRPKKIFLMANNLKTLPLIEKAIDDETGSTFKKPIKIKIFRRSVPGQVVSEFRRYMNGELFDDDTFVDRPEDFVMLYTNKQYIISIHKIYPRKFYVQANHENKKKIYKELDYLSLKIFCQQSSNNEFYYQNKKVGAMFASSYPSIVNEMAFFASENGHRFLV